MPSASFFAAFGAAPNVVFVALWLLYVGVSAYVYISLIHQISVRADPESFGVDTARRSLGLPEAILSAALIVFLLLNIGASVSHPSIDFSAPTLLGNFLLMVFVVLFIVTFLQLRGFDVGVLAGFSRIGFLSTLRTGAILLFFAYPLILSADIITQRLFGGGSSRQTIVEFFSGPRTLEQRIMIIVFAIAVAPVIEEFLFRFFLYNVIKRYLGRLVGVTFSALLFAAAHAHFLRSSRCSFWEVVSRLRTNGAVPFLSR